jgi:hypothetical protein
MSGIRWTCLLAVMCLSPLAIAQEPAKKIVPSSQDNAQLEKVLWGVEQEWLCSSGNGPHHKDYKDCVNFRSQFWPDTFFEISVKGEVQNKKQMVASQMAAAPTHAPGVGPYPHDFKLRAVYGDVALATDTTDFKTADASGKLSFTSTTTVLRMFVKQNGEWRPAGAALVPVVK